MQIHPRATYRLQLRPGFGFDEAAELVDYLAELGVSHLYTSPCLQARAGSSHGYDIVDFGRANEELGGEEALRLLGRALERQRMGLLLDVVANHMAMDGQQNRWWWDVLEKGHASRYAAFFDIEWDEVAARGGLPLPVLADRHERVLTAGEIRVAREGKTLVVRYGDRTFPVAPDSLPTPRGDEGALDDEAARINADPARLDALLERQTYRLAHWRCVERELAYRRFFDIDDLVALRMEDPHVFAATHALVLRWRKEGLIAGIRVDHVDGLRDPEGYLRRLRSGHEDAWIVVEKILAPGEQLPRSWPVDGTTGYDFLNRIGGLFVDPAGEAPLTEFYAEFTGEAADYRSVLIEKKRLALDDLLTSDLQRLVRLLRDVCARHHCGHGSAHLAVALREVAAQFPVYRSYVRPHDGKTRPEDEQVVTTAVEAAREARRDLPPEVFSFLRDVLLLRIGGERALELALRFQQLTGPAMAKGAEDTAFYCFNRFVALNEVGGDPAHFGISAEAFHRACAEAQRRASRGLLASSTHDTKRGEDVRARLALLSEIPDVWAAAVRRWSARNERHRQAGCPDRNAEYLFYQTMVGAWPIDVERAVAYMEKAAREAKVYTSWRRRNSSYEEALRAFVAGALRDEGFRSDLEGFVSPLVAPGRVNGLAQTLVKLTAPGVPDLYQGTELWDLSLVDPDNRRPVDFAARRRLLGGLNGERAESIWERADEGLPKLWLIRRALGLRARCPQLFDPDAGYEPLAARGARSEHVVAFARGGRIVTVVPRLVLGVGDDWAGTRLPLPRGLWRNELTGDVVQGRDVGLHELFAHFPVALLSSEERGS
jgi:(1->4)-alpha-D-glucan 1-alpha-D-glucosylmutase